MDTLKKEPATVRSVSELSDKEWETALKRYAIIAPLLNEELKSASITEAAKAAGFSRMTLYRWIERYMQTRSVSSLADNKRMGGEGKSRTTVTVEEIMSKVINDRYLKKQKLTVRKISIEIAVQCRNAGLIPPHYTTVNRRIDNISEEEKLTKRYDSSIARNRYKPVDGSFPHAEYPLAAVQIDHTPLDIFVVDETCREVVGKPYITLAIDVYSRMVIGFYISLDPPGALGTGLCLSHAILPKEVWLSNLEVTGKWPCKGIMQAIYMDNAKEFRGKMLERACQEYGIEINFRPVATPNYGGHIERLLGTILRQVHSLPGTTFSNIKDRKYYNAEGKACFTLKELEQWLATYIVQVYHNQFHKGIGTTPLAKYNEGISGNAVQMGVGQRPMIEDTLKLKLDFMPIVERTIQRQGVSIDNIYYYQDILRKWVNSYEEPNARYKVRRKFDFKQDPRDISAIYFYEPHIKQYFCIPYRNIGRPSMTVWEHRRIVKDLNARGMLHVNEDMIFEAYSRLRRLEQNAVTVTAATRRRKKNTRKELAEKNSVKHFFTKQEPDYQTGFRPDPNEEYLPFEELIHDPFNTSK